MHLLVTYETIYVYIIYIFKHMHMPLLYILNNAHVNSFTFPMQNSLLIL